jgi:Protein of unknown function (DUF2948)
MTDPLRLRAIDTLDLSVIAAHLQDALVKMADLGFDKSKRRFALIFNRFMWEDLEAEKGKGAKADKNAPYRRVRSALHFDAVQRVQTQGLRLANTEALAALMTVAFEAKADLSGTVTLTFAGGGAIKLDVECLDAWLTDLSAPWPTKNKPGHGLDEAM